jgi:hypothetical protein
MRRYPRASISHEFRSSTEKDRFSGGYDLRGIGAEALHSPPTMQLRGFRQEAVLASHDGIKLKGSDCFWEGPGFRYRARHDGV